jgi:hypothetical protein
MAGLGTGPLMVDLPDALALAEFVSSLGFAHVLPWLFVEEIRDITTLLLCNLNDFVDIGIPERLAADLRGALDAYS